jgi:hypothetical protein
MKSLEDLERDIEKLWKHVTITACLLCFTEVCDLIVMLAETFGGN